MDALLTDSFHSDKRRSACRSILVDHKYSRASAEACNTASADVFHPDLSPFPSHPRSSYGPEPKQAPLLTGARAP